MRWYIVNRVHFVRLQSTRSHLQVSNLFQITILLLPGAAADSVCDDFVLLSCLQLILHGKADHFHTGTWNGVHSKRFPHYMLVLRVCFEVNSNLAFVCVIIFGNGIGQCKLQTFVRGVNDVW